MSKLGFMQDLVRGIEKIFGDKPVRDNLNYNKKGSEKEKKTVKNKKSIILGIVAVAIVISILLIPNIIHQKEQPFFENEEYEKDSYMDNDRVSTNFDSDEEVLRIRELYNSVQSNLQNLTRVDGNDEIVYYYDSKSELVRMDIPENSTTSYTKYYYFKDGDIYFAFIFDGTKENRLYFKNNKLFRWIDESGVTHDYSENDGSFREWENEILNDLNHLGNVDVYTASDIVTYMDVAYPTDSVDQSPFFNTYVNNQFGIQIDYPAHFKRSVATNEKLEKIYVSDDGSAMLKIVAGKNKGNITSRELCNEIVATYGGEITYNPVKDTWFALSISDGIDDHYAYYRLDEGEIRGFEFHFKGTENIDTYSKYIDHIYESFKRY